MTKKKEIYYPNVGQSWGIVGIAILSMLIFSPGYVILQTVLGKEISFLVYYLLAMGIPFIIAHTIKNKRTGNIKYDFNPSSMKIILLVSIATIAIQAGVILPILNQLPMPEFMKKAFLELANQNGVFSFITIVIAAPIIEELIFKGIILNGLLQRYSPSNSIIISSVLFGIVHLNPWQFISALVIGVFSGWVYYRTRKLMLPIIIHFVNNLLAFIEMYFIDAETMISGSPTEIYGNVLNLVLITVGAITVSIISILLLKKEFNSVNVN